MSRDEVMSTGLLTVFVYVGNQVRPIENATVTVSSTQDTKEPVSFTQQTDKSGRTAPFVLPAPSSQYTQQPSDVRPFSEYNLKVTAPGFKDVDFSGVQIFADAPGFQLVQLSQEAAPPLATTTPYFGDIVIDPHGLYVIYPPKIPEDPFAIPDPPPSGSVVLDSVVIPQYVQVHDGVPNDTSAPNYTVDFRTYLKNVGSSEIYSTWPREAIKANLLAINSFLLNRIFTEHYRGKGFTITTSTAYDQKYNRGGTVYQQISEIVDEIFTQYIGLKGKKQPFLAQYCDGKMVKCPGWMTQWGSKALADEGKTAFEILRSFYGPDIELREAPSVEGIPESFPGFVLKEGSSGAPVRKIQEFLNAIGNNFPAIPKVKVDGVFGPSTTAAVKKFQEIFNMPVTGIVDRKTWYRISDIYSSVEKLAQGPSGGPVRSSQNYTNRTQTKIITPTITTPTNTRSDQYETQVQWVPMWVPYVTYRKKNNNQS